ncbi:hypothetical protein Agub_g3791, partial [Astrephomene gubernaculifera]
LNTSMMRSVIPSVILAAASLRSSAFSGLLSVGLEKLTRIPCIHCITSNLPHYVTEADSQSGSQPIGPPTGIKLLKKEKRLELTYSDGAKVRLPAELLRVCSPSADTRRVNAHSGRVRVVSGRRHVGIMSVEPVGNYAIRIHFDDLHSSGIFTWNYLAHLGGPGRWPAMREYLRLLREAGASRDPRPRSTRTTTAAAAAGKEVAAAKTAAPPPLPQEELQQQPQQR